MYKASPSLPWSEQGSVRLPKRGHRLSSERTDFQVKVLVKAWEPYRLWRPMSWCPELDSLNQEL